MIENNWITEYFTSYEAHMHKVKKVFLDTSTKFQKVEMVDTYFFGKCLFLDGKIQSSIQDEFIYHESLVHPAMLLHPNPKKVLILGAGEGAIAREILKYKSVESVLMLDIDQELVEICKEYLPEMSNGSFDDPKSKVIFQDARKYLEENSEKFDLIIGDLPEPLEGGPAYLLYTQEFYKSVFNRLEKFGILVLQSGPTSCVQSEMFSIVLNTLKSVFPIVRGYESNIPSFDMPWGFAFASSEIDPISISKKDLQEKIQNHGLNKLKYYDENVHFKMFTLPKYLKEKIDEQVKIIKDADPYYLPA
ncbi:MAG: polyamine aminopropyltransferase [bacterium]